jgi:hypothetical protein
MGQPVEIAPDLRFRSRQHHAAGVPETFVNRGSLLTQVLNIQ